MTSDGPSAPAVEVCLLGSFQARVHGQLRPLPHSVERLVALVTLRGPLGRTHASALLWPDVGPARARASLRATVSRLANVADGILRRSGEVLALDETVVVDVALATSWIEATIYEPVGMAATPPPANIGRPLLPGWDEEWLEGPRERLQMLQAQALETAAERLLAAGHLGEALPYALSAIDLQPWSESANRLVIEIHARRGDPSNALRRYRRFRRELQEELGVEPGPDMRAAIRRLYPLSTTLGEAPATRSMPS